MNRLTGQNYLTIYRVTALTFGCIEPVCVSSQNVSTISSYHGLNRFDHSILEDKLLHRSIESCFLEDANSARIKRSLPYANFQDSMS